MSNRKMLRIRPFSPLRYARKDVVHGLRGGCQSLVRGYQIPLGFAVSQQIPHVHGQAKGERRANIHEALSPPEQFALAIPELLTLNYHGLLEVFQLSLQLYRGRGLGEIKLRPSGSRRASPNRRVFQSA